MSTIRRGGCDLVINTPEGRNARYAIREAALTKARAVHHDALGSGGRRARDDRARRAGHVLQRIDAGVGSAQQA